MTTVIPLRSNSAAANHKKPADPIHLHAQAENALAMAHVLHAPAHQQRARRDAQGSAGPGRAQHVDRCPKSSQGSGMTHRARSETVKNGGIWKGTWGAGDYFEGTAEALITANLCTPEEMPGMPNCGKNVITFGADGTRSPKGTSAEPGRRQIRRIGADWFRVRVTVSQAEQRSRAESYSMWAKEQRVAATFVAVGCALDAAIDVGDSKRRARLGDDLYWLVVQRKHLSVVPPTPR